MATNYFLKIDSIEGESRDSAHTGWVEAQSFHASVHNASNMGSGKGGAGAVRPNFSDFFFQKDVDKSTPNFAGACATAKQIPNIEVECCTTIDGEQKPYLKYKFTDCIISGSSVNGMMDQQPMEEISIAYAKIEWTYTAFDDKGGSQGDTVKSFNLVDNKGA